MVGIHDADDLIQTALLSALRHLDDFPDAHYSGFLAYLRQIVLNEVRSELRRLRCRGENVEFDDSIFVTVADPVIEHLLIHDRHKAYSHALQQLNPRQQKYVALRIESGMSFREISAKVGGSADNARMIVSRALRTLSKHLATVAA